MSGIRRLVLIGVGLAAACWPGMAQDIITTLAGTGVCNSSGATGPAIAAGLCSAHSAAVDAAGNIYFGDNFRIKKITPDGTISTIAGTGVYGYSGDNGPALSATMGFVNQIAIYGTLLCFADSAADKIRCFDLNFGLIAGLGTGISGTGGDGGPVSNASFLSPQGVAFDDAGNLYVADFSANSVRRIAISGGTITMFAGPGPGYCCAPLGDGGPAVGADLYEPMGIYYRNGALYIADTGNSRIRRVDLATGMISSVAASDGSFVRPGFWIVLDPAGNLYNSLGTAVQKIDPAGVVTTIAGSVGISGYGSDDIPATQTYFGGIGGLGWDPVANRLLIADNGTRLRQIFYTPPTTTMLTSSANPAVPGGQITLQATVSPTGATGSVRFYQDNLLLGSVPMSNGIANQTWTAPFGGFSSYGMRAVYGGDATHNLSTSATVPESVQQGTTSTAVSSGTNPSTQGQSVIFTVTVTPAAANGTVYLTNGTTQLGTATLSGGVATFNVASLPVGTNSITAAYGGGSSYLSSVSPGLTQVVKAATTTSLAAGPNPSVYGDAVTLTATVSPATPTGAVQFFNGATLLGSANLTGGQAQISTSSLPAGANSLSAVYAGDTGNGGSTSAAVTQTVSKKASTVTLSSSANPSTLNQTVSITATVSPSQATGTVQFLDGSTTVGTVALNGGSASVSLASLTLGDHAITVIYSGDANMATSTSAVLTQTVAKTATSVALLASPNPAMEGQTVTLTAVVTPSTATGLVQFFEGGSALLGTVTVSGGTASLTLTAQTYAFTVGTHAINANYNGDANDAIGTSTVVTLTVIKRTATSVTVTSSANPVTSGQPVTFTAQVTPSGATGTVQFLDGSTVFATGTISGGAASVTTSSLPVGGHSILAVYSGDVNDAGSVSSGLAQTIAKPSVNVALTASPNPATVGQTVTLSVVLTPGTATGLVQFFEGGSALLGTVPVNNGTASLTLTPQTYAFAVGTHALNANYNGDANFAVSSSPVITLSVSKAASSVALTSSVNPAMAGQPVNLMAAVSPGTATGTVQFLDGGTALGTVTVTGGAAALSISTLAVGTHSITAVYGGDGNYSGSTSGSLTQTISVGLPGAPANLTATAASSSQINLGWSASAGSGITYNIYSSATSGFTPSAANRIAAGVTGTSYSNAGLAASTTRYYRVTAQNPAGESAASNQAVATTSSNVSCHVNYRVTTQWNVGFGTDISIQNTGSTAISGWNLTWTWTGNERITESWNSTYSQTGANAKLTNATWNGSIAAGGTVSGVGFNGSYSGTNPTPTAFYLNGTLCH